tara:strand:+ start:1954 stop:2346 length:393 start_codon:yes stop_codon:yes gene_type:complete
MKQYLVALLVGFSLYSCDFPDYYWEKMPECKVEIAVNHVSYLERYRPEDFRYSFITFTQEDEEIIMYTKFVSENGCITVPVLVERWDKLEGMLKANGKSYPKELYELHWSLQDRDGRTLVVYEDMHRIID